MTSNEIRDRVLKSVERLLTENQETIGVIDDNTHLIRDLGLTSLDGGDLHADLCESLGIDLPLDTNPLVLPSGKQGRRFGQLVTLMEGFVNAKSEIPA